MNEHAGHVLDAYLDAEKLAVPHAILVEGPWGSGKTYFLQNVYEPARAKQKKAARLHHTPFLFVSLFGANSAKEVEMRIYRTAYPGEALAGGIAGTFALGIGEFFRVKDTAKAAVEKLGERAIKKLSDFVFVFDDLERVEPKAFGEIMGLINSFIAEHGRRVLLVADENKLVSQFGQEIWTDQNEKIVGRRARIVADLEGVIHASIKELPKGAAKSHITANVESLIEVAHASGVENLRNVRWAMHNATAFVECLVDERDIPRAHILRTLCVVFATTLWMRSGLLDAETLQRLPGLSTTLAFRSVIRGKEDEPLDPQLARAKTFSETFAALNVESAPVDFRFISDFEKTGVLDRAEVPRSIKLQFGFGREYSEPAWRRLWYSHERPIADTEQAVSDLKAELEQRMHTKAGPLLHSAGLALRQWAVNDRRLTDGQDVVTYFKRYIDDLADKRLLEATKFGYHPADADSFGGLGINSNDTNEFREILRYFRQKSEEVTVAYLLAKAEALLDQADNGNLDALFDLVRDDERDLSSSPILLHVPVERVAALMTKDAPELAAGTKMLAYRYHHARNGSPLLAEIQWARNVYADVARRLEDWKEPHRTMALKYMKGLIAHYDQDKLPDDRLIPDL